MSDRFENTYVNVRAELQRRLAEPAPGRIQIVSGPRQVGKTTLLLELVRGFGAKAIYESADTPEAQLAGWWESFASRRGGGVGDERMVEQWDG